MSRVPRTPRVDPQPFLPELEPAQPREAPEGEDLSPAMQRVMAMAARVAPVNSTVLITGESGVGKERLARWLHESSRRRGRAFVAVNCGAFTDTLLESELFGHARGAFTGAVGDRPGVFEAAHGGTLFLDEIGEVSTAMQVRLLRVLQEREVRRVGETRTRAVDVRLVAATNRDLPREMRSGTFRADLYYRLRVVELAIPPLRERPHDLAQLLDILLQPIAAKVGAAISGYTSAARLALMSYSWPGNVRELEHALERACVMASDSAIDLDDLPDSIRSTTPPPVAIGGSIVERERRHVEAVLARHGGDRRRAAAELGISQSTLKRRLRGSTSPRVPNGGSAHE